MNLDAFNQDREADWQRLEQLLQRAGGHPERLGVDGALQLGTLYRAASADLALLRRRTPDDPLVQRLETLVVSGRRAIYDLRERHGSPRTFFAHGYWRSIRERPGILAAALLALWGPALAGALWAINDPGAAIGLVPGAFRAAANPHVHSIATGAATQAGLAGSIFTNNIQVTFMAFAGGLLLGIGTLASLAYNGLLLGTLAGLTIQGGSFSVFVRYVAPHGMLELSCITISGVAGLRLAMALIDPGDEPRLTALRNEARGAIALVLGTAPWLVLAGCVEGFITPRGLPLGLALIISVALGGLFWSLVLWRGALPAQIRARAFALR